LKQFYFNICPENSNCAGYVTEKVFEAISAGCIPIYWGDYNHPEPSILNEEAILFWQKDEDNQDLIQKISGLFSSPEEMDRFLRLPRLKEGAEVVVWEMFEALDSAIDSILKA
jgi:Glycosyltransferase family 10 (fucosyltransferase).